MQTNVRIKPFQMRIVIVLNTHGLQSAANDDYFYLLSKYHLIPCSDIAAVLKWNVHIINLFHLAYSQLRWVLLLKMSCDKSFSWLLLRSLLEKINTTVLNTHGFQTDDRYFYQEILNRFYFFPNSFFHLRTIFSLQQPIV